MLVTLLFAQLAASSPAGIDALVGRARLARYQQDSALAEYRVIAKQRMSAGIGLSTVFGVGVPGPEKLAARFESVARIGWNHQTGAWGEVIGARGVAPLVGETTPGGSPDVALVLPYNPGADALWPMTELRGAFHDHRDWITHPLDAGSDTLYQFSLGDSVTIRLPTGRSVRLREIRVQPRRPSERLIVGSLWVDDSTGSLVRAAYRPSTPVDLYPLMQAEMDNDEEGQRALKMFGPYTGVVREVIIEHGLYESRFWLPRIRIASGEGTAHGARASISIEQTFAYEHVVAMPAGQHANLTPPPADTAADGRRMYSEWNGQVMRGPCRQAGDSARWTPDVIAADSSLSVMYVQGIRFRMLSACNSNDLVTSPSLPGSIYGKGEALFTESDFAKLRRDVSGALALDRQAKWNPQPAAITWGWKRGLLRYNRVEGLSGGVVLDQTLGAGYEATYNARIGLADLQPNGEATITRTNVRSELRATAFRRLATANEWGDPFGLGPSAVALLFGRDDGLYYRALGAEFGGDFRRAAEGAVWSWRAFADREDSARVETQQSLPHAIHGATFAPNIQADAGGFFGGTLIGMNSWGANPRGARLTAFLRGEGVGGAAEFGRGSMEFTLSQGFGRSGEATLTASAGSSLGDVTTQKLWYLGGPNTVRGFSPGAMTGDAFWFGRFEIASGHPVARPAIFADIGWAGDRANWSTPGKPISGVGVGMTFIDGIIRLDVARASTGKFRADFYLTPR